MKNFIIGVVSLLSLSACVRERSYVSVEYADGKIDTICTTNYMGANELDTNYYVVGKNIFVKTIGRNQRGGAVEHEELSLDYNTDVRFGWLVEIKKARLIKIFKIKEHSARGSGRGR